MNEQNIVVEKKTNGFAVAGFILSIFTIVLGLIFSIIGICFVNKYKSGKGLSIAGIIISCIKIVLFIIFIFIAPFILIGWMIDTFGPEFEEQVCNQLTKKDCVLNDDGTYNCYGFTCTFDEEEIIKPKETTIPDVSGMTEKEAIEKLEEDGLIIGKIVEIESDTIPKGSVVKTTPAAGTKRKKGTEIIIYISSEKKDYKVEDFTGKNCLEVKAYLEALGIKVIINTKEINGEENIIIEQDLKPGTVLNEGDYITLYIPNIEITFPDFTDGTWSVEDVMIFCEEYEITCNIEYTGEYTKGTIGKQSRKEGYKINRGSSELTIYVGK